MHVVNRVRVVTPKPYGIYMYYETLQVHAWHWDDVSWTRKTTLACFVFQLSALDLVPYSKPCVGHNSKTIWIYLWKSTDACMTLRRCVMNMEDNLAYLVYELSALDLTKFHIVNCVWTISTLIITSCCTCHNYICNLFLNGILAGASVSYGHFF